MCTLLPSRDTSEKRDTSTDKELLPAREITKQPLTSNAVTGDVCDASLCRQVPAATSQSMTAWSAPPDTNSSRERTACVDASSQRAPGGTHRWGSRGAPVRLCSCRHITPTRCPASRCMRAPVWAFHTEILESETTMDVTPQSVRVARYGWRLKQVVTPASQPLTASQQAHRERTGASLSLQWTCRSRITPKFLGSEMTTAGSYLCTEYGRTMCRATNTEPHLHYRVQAHRPWPQQLLLKAYGQS